MDADRRSPGFVPRVRPWQRTHDPALLFTFGATVDVLTDVGFGAERIRGTVVRAATEETPIAILVIHGCATRRVEIRVSLAREVFAFSAGGVVADRLGQVQAARWARRAAR